VRPGAPALSYPSFTLRAAAEYAALGYAIEGVSWPKQYLAGKQQLEALARRARMEAEQKQAELRAAKPEIRMPAEKK
jgi:hypothetical protein